MDIIFGVTSIAVLSPKSAKFILYMLCSDTSVLKLQIRLSTITISNEVSFPLDHNSCWSGWWWLWPCGPLWRHLPGCHHGRGQGHLHQLLSPDTWLLLVLSRHLLESLSLSPIMVTSDESSSSQVCLALYDCPVLDESMTNTTSGSKGCSPFTCGKESSCEGTVVRWEELNISVSKKLWHYQGRASLKLHHLPPIVPDQPQVLLVHLLCRRGHLCWDGRLPSHAPLLQLHLRPAGMQLARGRLMGQDFYRGEWIPVDRHEQHQCSIVPFAWLPLYRWLPCHHGLWPRGKPSEILWRSSAFATKRICQNMLHIWWVPVEGGHGTPDRRVL